MTGFHLVLASGKSFEVALASFLLGIGNPPRQQGACQYQVFLAYAAGFKNVQLR